LHARQVDLVQAAAGPGREPAEVVADLGYLHGGALEGPGHLRERAGVLRGFDQVQRFCEREACDLGQSPGYEVSVAGRAVDPGADGGRAHVQLVEFLGGAGEGGHGGIDHDGVGAELLPEGHRDRVLVLGAAHLQHVGKLVGLCAQEPSPARPSRPARP
jgi:hypothetical protein